MAKETERKELKREKTAKSHFNLIGKAKVTDNTFKLDKTYGSGWTANEMYLGVDCGNGNLVYVSLNGGYFPDRDSVLIGYSKEEKDAQGNAVRVEVAWEDRLDTEILDELSDYKMFKVGIEKDVKGKTVRKAFLSGYDAAEYLAECLEDGMIVNISGDLKYSEYDGKVSVSKEVKSVYLSKVEDENDFKATFAQTVLIDKESIGKKNEEKDTLTFNAYVMDYVGTPKIDGKKVEVKKNVVFPYTFEVEISQDNPVATAKMLDKYFKVTKKTVINELTVVGKLIEGGSVVNITSDDIPDDIKELIELGLYSEDEAKTKMAVGNQGDREKRMVITKPDISYIGEGDNRKACVAFKPNQYTIDDLYFYEQAILEATSVHFDEDVENQSEGLNAAIEEDEDILAMLENM